MNNILLQRKLPVALVSLALTAGSLLAQTYVPITNLLFSETFSGYEPGAVPTTVAAGGLWGTLSHSGPGSYTVTTDDLDVFTQGTTNQFLRVASTYNLSLITPAFSLPQEAVIFAFDYIGRYPEGDTARWLNVNLRSGTLASQITSIRNNTAVIRTASSEYPPNPSIGGLEVPVRILTVMNNKAEAISYDRPDGGGTDQPLLGNGFHLVISLHR